MVTAYWLAIADVFKCAARAPFSARWCARCPARRYISGVEDRQIVICIVRGICSGGARLNWTLSIQPKDVLQERHGIKACRYLC